MKCRLNRSLLVAVVFILGAGCATTQSPLIVAAAKGDTDSVRALLARCAEVNAKDNDGYTALSFATYFAYTDTVKVLFAAAVDVNAKDKKGKIA